MVLVVLWAAGCGSDPPAHAEAAAANSSPSSGTSAKTQSSAPLRVVVERPKPAQSGKGLVLPGTVHAWESAALYARVTGYLDSVSVDIGDR
jgi:HlyD family secretion protein